MWTSTNEKDNYCSQTRATSYMIRKLKLNEKGSTYVVQCGVLNRGIFHKFSLKVLLCFTSWETLLFGKLSQKTR